MDGIQKAFLAWVGAGELGMRLEWGQTTTRVCEFQRSGRALDVCRPSGREINWFLAGFLSWLSGVLFILYTRQHSQVRKVRSWTSSWVWNVAVCYRQPSSAFWTGWLLIFRVRRVFFVSEGVVYPWNKLDPLPSQNGGNYWLLVMQGRRPFYQLAIWITDLTGLVRGS